MDSLQLGRIHKTGSLPVQQRPVGWDGIRRTTVARNGLVQEIAFSLVSETRVEKGETGQPL